MYYKIIDEENRIGCCASSDIREDYKAEMLTKLQKVEYVTFFYDSDDNMLILNENSEVYDYFKNVVISFFNLSANSRLLKISEAKKIDENIYNSMIMINAIGEKIKAASQRRCTRQGGTN